jgi:hypothetical protein
MAASADQLEFVQATAGVRASVEGQLTGLLNEVVSSGSSPAEMRDAMARLTRTLVAEYGSAAADFAAGWYNDMRLTAGVGGNFTALSTTQDFTLPINDTVRRAVGTLFTPNPDIVGMVTAIVSKAGKYAALGAKDTVALNAGRDPRASGWHRIPVGPTCDFCLMLVGRGGVYKKANVGFRAHGHCDCGSAPSWDLGATEVPSIAYEASSRMQALRDRAAAGDSGAQRQLNAYRGRVQSYIADNQAEFAQLRQTYNLTPAV